MKNPDLRFRRNPSETYDVGKTLPNAPAEPFVRAMDRVDEDLAQIDLDR